MPSKILSQKYVSTYALSYTNNIYKTKELISNTTKLKEEKVAEDEEGVPAKFTYDADTDMLVVGFTDGKVHTYMGGVLVDTFK